MPLTPAHMNHSIVSNKTITIDFHLYIESNALHHSILTHLLCSIIEMEF